MIYLLRTPHRIHIQSDSTRFWNSVVLLTLKIAENLRHSKVWSLRLLALQNNFYIRISENMQHRPHYEKCESIIQYIHVSLQTISLYTKLTSIYPERSSLNSKHVAAHLVYQNIFKKKRSCRRPAFGAARRRSGSIFNIFRSHFSIFRHFSIFFNFLIYGFSAELVDFKFSENHPQRYFRFSEISDFLIFQFFYHIENHWTTFASKNIETVAFLDPLDDVRLCA